MSSEQKGMSVVELPWLESSFYKEAVENAASYNGQLMRDRRSRLPYIDAQTGIAQRDCRLWRNRLERRPGALPGQIYSYQPFRWRLEATPDPAKVASSTETSSGEVPPVTQQQQQQPAAQTQGPSGLVQTVEGGILTKRSSRIAGLSKKDESVVLPPGVRVSMESPHSSEINEESDNDADYLDEYESEEERRSKRKKKPVVRTRTQITPQRTTRDHEKDKPHACPVCHRRYKTLASLKAHHTQYHPGEFLRQDSEPEGSAVISPPLLLVKKQSKRNPYCDFCLGDDAINKKTNVQERMVSCADCGRSAHPVCLQFSPALAAVVLTYNWQCIECKSCSLCGKSDNDDQLLFCDDCDRGYHMYCLTPPIKEPPEGSWSCGMCKK